MSFVEWKRIRELNLGFSDAENYRRKENKALFNTIFVKNAFLDKLLRPSTFFLVGEKGTGKTAYSVFLANNEYNNFASEIKFLRETDYQKFVNLKKEKHLQLSDYSSIWKVILLLLMAKSLRSNELDHFLLKNKKIKMVMNAIDEYYASAFAPEIVNAMTMVENSKAAAEIMLKYAKAGAETGVNITFQESKFQINLFYIEQQFEEAFRDLKIKKNHILFIDGIDIRPGSIPYADYLECVKGLAAAVWSLNNDFFSQIKDSPGRFRVVLLVRPDIFNSIGLQNQSNKLRDNSVYLDWRTTYPTYRSSYIFELSDRLLAAQQENHPLPLGYAWDHYFPWTTNPAPPYVNPDASFTKFLRLSYSRPRDIVTMVQLLQEERTQNGKDGESAFSEADVDSYDFLNKYSEYLMAGIKDQLSFYYTEDDYRIFIHFFSFLGSRADFDSGEYKAAYGKFVTYVLDQNKEIPEFVETAEIFLQFLYDTNILCYVEELETEKLFRWCYRERSLSNIAPKVKTDARYRIHYGLMKALNVGYGKMKKIAT
jgi:hypothetical protein